MKGFLVSLDYTFVLTAELEALFTDFKIAKQLGYIIILRWNATISVLWPFCMKRFIFTLLSAPIINVIKSLCEQNSSDHFKHIFREANTCADHIVSLASNIRVRMEILNKLRWNFFFSLEVSNLNFKCKCTLFIKHSN